MTIHLPPIGVRSVALRGDELPLSFDIKESSMKKQIKKLTLNRETLRSLTEGQLTMVEGAASSPQYSRCINNSCGIACTVDTCIDC